VTISLTVSAAEVAELIAMPVPNTVGPATLRKLLRAAVHHVWNSPTTQNEEQVVEAILREAGIS